jgi:hypothetical protein
MAKNDLIVMCHYILIKTKINFMKNILLSQVLMCLRYNNAIQKLEMLHDLLFSQAFGMDDMLLRYQIKTRTAVISHPPKGSGKEVVW